MRLHAERIDNDARGLLGANHFTDSAADTPVADHGRHRTVDFGRGETLEPNCVFSDWTFDDAKITDFSLVGSLRERSCIPSIHGFVPQAALKAGASSRPVKPLPRACETRVGSAETSDAADDLFFRMDVMRECAGRAGENAGERVTRKIAGLFARVDEGDAAPEAFVQVCKGDRIDRTDLNALTAFDASPKKVRLDSGARRPETRKGSSDDRPVRDRLKHQDREARQAGANQPSAPLLLTTQPSSLGLLD